MIRTITAALVLCALAFSPAQAKKLLSPGASKGMHPMCNITMPCDQPSASTLREVRTARGKYVARQLGIGGPVTPVYRTIYKRGHVHAAIYTEPPITFDVGRPSRYIAGRLICAINVGAALAERGIKGTGSALALSYLHWGRSAGGPVVGAVIVSARRGGGHVAIVSRVEGGVVYAWNATGGQRGWREIAYRHRVLDYRVPG